MNLLPPPPIHTWLLFTTFKDSDLCHKTQVTIIKQFVITQSVVKSGNHVKKHSIFLLSHRKLSVADPSDFESTWRRHLSWLPTGNGPDFDSIFEQSSKIWTWNFNGIIRVEQDYRDQSSQMLCRERIVWTEISSSFVHSDVRDKSDRRNRVRTGRNEGRIWTLAKNNRECSQLSGLQR